MLDRKKHSPREAERKAGAYLPQFETRMAPHIVREVEGLLQRVRDTNIATALRTRTQQASPETTQLIQHGMFDPDFSITNIPVYDEEGERVKDPEPYQVWEAAKEMRTVMTSVIAGLIADQMAAVIEGKNAFIWIPEEQERTGFLRRTRKINAVDIVPGFFRGFGEFITNSNEPFNPQQATPSISSGSEYMEQVGAIITREWLEGQRHALFDVVTAIRGLVLQHPLRIMEGNLKNIVAFGLDHECISRERMGDDIVYDFIDGGLGTQMSNTAALADLIPRVAEREGIQLKPEEFVTVFMNSVSLLQLGANGHLLFRVQALDNLKLPLSPEDEELLKRQENRGKIETGEEQVYQQFDLVHFTLQGKGDKAKVALIQEGGKSELDREEEKMRRLVYQESPTDDRLKLETPRVIARCPARQQRFGGKDDVITSQMNILGSRLYQLNTIYNGLGLLG